MKIKIGNISCIVALVSFVVGCASYQIVTPFDESALRPYAQYGKSTISGQAFEKTQGGDVKFGAGNVVSLIPVTPYTTEMTQAWCNGGGLPPQTDPQLQKYIRQAVADGNGNFEFHNIPAGDYYIICPIFWKVPDPTVGILVNTGGVGSAQTHVDAGQTVKVAVTNH